MVELFPKIQLNNSLEAFPRIPINTEFLTPRVLPMTPTIRPEDLKPIGYDIAPQEVLNPPPVGYGTDPKFLELLRKIVGYSPMPEWAKSQGEVLPIDPDAGKPTTYITPPYVPKPEDFIYTQDLKGETGKITPITESVYSYQDTHGEKFLNPENNPNIQDRAGLTYRIENAGDILREVSLRGNEHSLSYIGEKLKSIDNFLKDPEYAIGRPLTPEYLKALDRIKEQYSGQPVEQKGEQLALNLVHNLIDRDYLSAKETVNEIKTAIKDKTLNSNLSQPTSPTAKGGEIDILDADIPRGSKVVPLNYGALDNVGRRSFASVAKDNEVDISQVRQVNIPLEELNPKYEGSSDPDEMGRLDNQPAVEVVFDKNGKFKINDGNHRISAAQEQGYTHIPAWVVDKRISKLSPNRDK